MKRRGFQKRKRKNSSPFVDPITVRGQTIGVKVNKGDGVTRKGGIIGTEIEIRVPQTLDLSSGESDATRIGGRLLNYLGEWEKITSNPWVLQVISLGYRIEFISRPPERFFISNARLSSVSPMWSDIQDLLRMEAISPVPPHQRRTDHYSGLFSIIKPSGESRTIINLKPLNKWLSYKRFKMESIRSTIPLLGKDVVMCTLDLKSAYYHVPISLQHQKYLRFAIEKDGSVLHYQFRCLPFGLASAPRVFTKLIIEIVSFFKETGYHYNTISRRFPVSGRLSIPTQDRFSVSDLHTAETRLGGKLGEITLNPKIKTSVSGDNSRLRHQEVFSSGQKVVRFGEEGSTVCKNSGNNTRCNDDPRPDDSLYPMCQLEPISFSSIAESGSNNMGQKTVFVGQTVCPILSSQKIPTMVDGVRKPSGGGPMDPDPSSHGNHRCKSTRLGRPGTRKILPRTVEFGREQQFLKPQRATGGLEGSVRSPVPIKEQTSEDLIGQHDGGSFSSPSRGPETSETATSGGSDLRMGRRFGTFNFSSPLRRLKEPGCGFSEQEKTITHRVGTEQRNFRYPVSALGNPVRGSFRDQKKYKDKDLLLPESSRESSRGRCPFSVVELGSAIRLSPSGISTKGTQENLRGQSSGDPGGPFLGWKELVPPSKEAGSGQSLPSSSQGGLTFSGSDPPSEPRKVAVNSLDPERQILRAKGLSEGVISILQASRKPVTSAICLRTWRKFCSFCGDTTIDVDHPNIPKILDFLQQGFKIGLKPSTLRVQIAALSVFYDSSLAAHPWIARFSRAVSRLKPPIRKSVPPWDLNLVLNVLCKEPFDINKDINIANLSLKAVFLVAITSAK
ncbi:uncharacterized protein [Ranitomeya imitator]|uniref:uncharacterized protein n=1 Tax=Ranitomeya imitator TaxID=111125 RepID=UPI0037E7B5A7